MFENLRYPLADLARTRRRDIARKVFRGEQVDRREDAEHAVSLARWYRRTFVENWFARWGYPVSGVVLAVLGAAVEIVLRGQDVPFATFLAVQLIILVFGLWWWPRRVLGRRIDDAEEKNATLMEDEGDSTG